MWSEEARYELPCRALGRRLVVDYYASRCCGRNVSVGNLHLRWMGSSEPIAEEFLRLPAPAVIEAYVQRDLVGVLDAAGGQIVMRGWRRLRHPVIELVDGALWLDFVSACRARNPLRH